MAFSSNKRAVGRLGQCRRLNPLIPPTGVPQGLKQPEPPPTRMRRERGLFLIAQMAAIIAVLALVSLPMQPRNGHEVSTSSNVNERPYEFASGVSPQGLQLEVIMNSSSLQSHGAISARVEVLNTFGLNVSLPGIVLNQNISEWNAGDYVCSSGASSFVGFALFRGHVAACNVTAAGQPLQLAPPEVIYCAATSRPPGAAVTFLPKGDRAVVTSDTQEPTPVTVGVNATTGNCGDNPSYVGYCTGKGLSGYWNDSIPAPGALNFTSPAFSYFPPGEYTIVATDLWGQFVYATFTVE